MAAHPDPEAARTRSGLPTIRATSAARRAVWRSGPARARVLRNRSPPQTKGRTSMDILLIILIGLIAGALAGRVVSGHGYGMLGDIVVGVVGALLGGWVLLRVFGVVAGGLIGSLVTAFIGAVILLWLIRLVAPGRA